MNPTPNPPDVDPDATMTDEIEEARRASWGQPTKADDEANADTETSTDEPTPDGTAELGFA